MQTLTAAEAVATLASDATVVIGGSGGGHAVPEALLEALEERYLTTAEPRDLTTIHPVGLGDKKSRGAHRLRHKGLLKRVVCGTVVDAPGIGEAAARGDLELFTVPQGSLSQLMRDSAARRPGLITSVGVGTYVDPRLGGGSQGAPSDRPPSEAVDLDGEDYILYRSVRPDAAFLRGTTADERGNVSMEGEAYFGEMLSMAQATRNNGGRVVVQVARVVPAGTIPPKTVKIPYFLVDDIVVVPDQPTTYTTPVSPAFAGAERVEIGSLPPLPAGTRGLIARRAARELTPGAVCNLGSGISTGVSLAAAEQGVLDAVTLTNEQGLNGGLPASGLDAGAAVNYDAMLDQPYQFDFYDGGGLDIAFLSFAEVSARGDVNISRFGGRIVGVGGFVNISQGARKVVFSGTLTAGGLEVAWDRAAQRLSVVTEGRSQRFVEAVEQISFSGPLSQRRGQTILFVTERCVFSLDADGLTLVEVAPGIDVARDIAPHVGFAFRIADDCRPMDPALFDASY
ncbi:3-oxoacid CoA-transferase [Cryptosporangium phraense]|uniref:3-oxoacid CoA-transferase n=2 Tax=Cryptosporangium phraense TaxID=2593070 RepID=A0A545AZD9_9ACTN|nr:3-oxoacid CoA-transferase [Cryptosporangium phraense]